MDNKWNKCKDVKPPLDEEVLILYKDRTDELKQENLHYGLAKRSKDINLDCERMSFYAQQPGYYDPVYWMSLPNMPIVEEKKVDWHDIPSNEMTLEQARQAVSELRKDLFEAIFRKREAIKEAYGNSEYTDEIIKALEQKPCGDCISRQMAIDSLGECPMVWMDSDAEITAERDWKDTVKMLKSLPSVIPQPKTEVLDKIRDEIERKAHSGQWSDATMYGMLKAVAIIDKYKTESEVEK